MPRSFFAVVSTQKHALCCSFPRPTDGPHPTLLAFSNDDLPTLSTKHCFFFVGRMRSSLALPGTAPASRSRKRFSETAATRPPAGRRTRCFPRPARCRRRRTEERVAPSLSETVVTWAAASISTTSTRVSSTATAAWGGTPLPHQKHCRCRCHPLRTCATLAGPVAAAAAAAAAVEERFQEWRRRGGLAAAPR